MALAHAAANPTVAEQVLAIVAQLVSELSEGAAPPTLDDVLDRDLGISSLERVELLLRLEQAFDVRLPDAVSAEAVTCRDLVDAVRQAGTGSAVPESTPPSSATPPTAGATAVPTTACSLIEALRWHADRSPDRTHIYLRNDAGTETPLTYAELEAAGTTLARGLRALGMAKGDRVAVMLRTERAFFEAFIAVLCIGAVPVPLYPPVRSEDLVAYTRRQEGILRNAGARLLITFAEAGRLAALLKGQVPSLEAVSTVDRLRTDGAPLILERMGADDPALIQYTSGSTGDPKGVLLSHGNLLANIRAIGAAFEIRDDDVAVSWLPLYHDMGLIGMWLGALYFGVPVAIMPPLAFLSRPSRWLWALHEHGGTISAAPNFAFDVCARKIAETEIEGLDLSHWRIAVNGSEAVNPDTIDRFTRRFTPHGFRADAMRPAYGLAESSVALTLGPLRRTPRVDDVAREPFERTREIRPASVSNVPPLRFVSCGRPLVQHRVRIVDRTGCPVGERIEGRIQFQGPSVTRGYFGNAEATRAALHDGWMSSGDLGYLADGELFITGREKDLIIQGGRNLCAEELEAITSRVPGIRAGSVAAFGVPDRTTGTERLVVVAETKIRDPGRREALERAVRDALVTGIGTPPDLVLIVAPRTVLKTSSGKVRRSAMRASYLAGTLGRRRSLVGQRARLLANAFGPRVQRVTVWLGRATLTAWVVVVLAVSLPMLWIYLAMQRPGRDADRAARWWSRFALAVCGLRPRVMGGEQLDGLDSGVLVANHASYLDPIVLMAAVPVPFHFVAKRALTRYPMIGTVICKAEHLTIEKAGFSDRLAGADDVERRLHDGDRLAIFAEGTFVRRPGLLPFRLGAFRAAVETGRPIVPVAIAGTRRVLPDGTWLFRRTPITVTIGTPLNPQGRGWPEMVRLRDATLDHIAHACGEDAAANAHGRERS